MKSRYEGPDGGSRSSDAIRTEIEETRGKMDNTLDRLEERLTPRHLLDEVLDYFRSHGPDRDQVAGKASAAIGKAGDTASQVMHVVSDTIRQHPIPALLVGAGIAYAVYESKAGQEEGYYEIEEDEDYFNSKYSYDDPGSSGFGPEGGELDTSEGGALKSSKEKVQEKLSAAGEQLKGGTERVKQRAKEIKDGAARRGRVIRIKASELKRRMAEGAQQKFYEKREQVARVTDEHPLSTGLGLLAAGLLVGLAMPSTRKEDEYIGRASDRFKQRAKEQGQELMERGKNVANAAVSAAKETAEEEGLTPEQLKAKAGHVLSETKSAAQQNMQKEGLTPEGMKENVGQVAHETKSAAQSAGQQQGFTSPNSPV
jgi:hypothetical protein